MTGRTIRYSFEERLCHWLTGLSYTYCLAGGLALYSPYLYWIASVLGGGATTRFWHPIGGALFFGSAIWMDVMWRRQMAFTEADREWTRNIKHYVRNQDDQVPPTDRFNAGQKQFYWAMFYGAIVLFLTGVVMWFPEYLPPGAHWLRSTAIVLHEVAALVTIGAFLIHIYMGVFFVRGSLEGIVTGTVPAGWARAHHRLWYDKVTRSAPKTGPQG